MKLQFKKLTEKSNVCFVSGWGGGVVEVLNSGVAMIFVCNICTDEMLGKIHCAILTSIPWKSNHNFCRLVYEPPFLIVRFMIIQKRNHHFLKVVDFHGIYFKLGGDFSTAFKTISGTHPMKLHKNTRVFRCIMLSSDSPEAHISTMMNMTLFFQWD